MKRFISALGKWALSLATMAFLVAASLFVVGSYLITWPVLRLSPKDRKIRATLDLASAGMEMMQVFGGKIPTPTSEPEPYIPPVLYDQEAPEHRIPVR